MANHCALSHCDFKMKLVCCGYRGNQEGTVSPHSSQGFYQATKCLKRRQDPPLPKGINLDLRGTHLSKQDGSSDKSTCSQTQQQEFNPWEPHGGTEHTEKAVLGTPYSGDMVNCAAAHVEVGGQLCGNLFPLSTMCIPEIALRSVGVAVNIFTHRVITPTPPHTPKKDSHNLLTHIPVWRNSGSSGDSINSLRPGLVG